MYPRYNALKGFDRPRGSYGHGGQRPPWARFGPPPPFHEHTGGPHNNWGPPPIPYRHRHPAPGPPPHRMGGPAFGGPQPHHANKRSSDPHQTSGPKQKKKKEKPPADTNPFYCKTCDRGYKQEHLYIEHNRSHIKCGIDGCPYTAAAKLVENHRELQHIGGLAKRIWQVESKEDIDKWISERKKNFPTKETVAKKETNLQEQIARGEVLETKQFGNFRQGRGRGRGRGRGWRDQGHRGRGRGRFHQTDTEIEATTSQNSKSQTDTCDKQTLEDNKECPVTITEKPRDPKLDPLAYVLNEESNDSDQEKKIEKSPQNNADTFKAPELKIKGGLGSLMASYADSEEGSGDEDPQPQQQQQQQQQQPQQQPQQGNEEKEEGEIEDDTGIYTKKTDEVREKSSPQSQENKELDRRREKRKRRKQNKKTNDHNANITSQKQSNHRGPKRPASLLEKLLAPEIRHERNVLLQCIRHIVKNNFFGEEKNSSEKSTSSSQNGPEEIISGIK